MRALIIGGGIGGLTTAVALQQQGIDVKVFEQMPEITEAGAGIFIQTNAMKVYDELGLGQELRAVSPPVDVFEIRSAKGTVLARFPYKEIAAEFGAPGIDLHRKELVDLLLQRIPPSSIQVAMRFSRFEQSDNAVKAFFEDGSQADGDVLIGADGVYSQVRKQVLGDSPPDYAGYVFWRGIATNADSLLAPGVFFESWGRGGRFGAVRMGKNRVYWYASANRPRDYNPGHQSKEEILGLFAHYHEPVEALVEQTDPSDILCNNTNERSPDSKWGEGRVTLLGDAIHPMSPNLGQGACQAVEDAFVLAQQLAATSDASGALRRYEERRRARTAYFQQRSRALGEMGQSENPVKCMMRNLFTRITPSSVWERQSRTQLWFDTKAS